MDDRIRSIAHRGKSILLVDLSNCTAAEVRKIAELVPKFVSNHPKGSVLLLADFSGAHFDRETVTVLKEATVFDRPHLKKSAWVGTDSLPKVFYDNIRTFSQRELPTFTTREEALDYLVEE